LGVSVQNFTRLGGRSDFLRPVVWSRVSGLMRFRGGSHKGTASSFIQISGKLRQTLEMIIQAFGKESTSHIWKIQTHRDRKRSKEESQELKLVFDQMALPVSEIMDGSLYICM
jgi:hypothetical protein